MFPVSSEQDMLFDGDGVWLLCIQEENIISLMFEEDSTDDPGLYF